MASSDDAGIGSNFCADAAYEGVGTTLRAANVSSVASTPISFHTMSPTAGA